MNRRWVVVLTSVLFFSAATLSYTGSGTVNKVDVGCDGDQTLTVNV